MGELLFNINIMGLLNPIAITNYFEIKKKLNENMAMLPDSIAMYLYIKHYEHDQY